MSGLSQTRVKEIQKEWKDLPESRLKSNQKSLDYIRELAARTDADLSKIDLFEVFGSGVDKDLITDFNEVNKRLFSTDAIKQTIDKATEKAKAATVTKRMRGQIKKICDSVKSRLFDNELTDKQAKHQFEMALERYQEERDMLIRRRMELRTGNRQKFEDKVVEGIEKVLKAGFWVAPIVSGKYLYFRTKDDVIVSHTHKKQGIRRTINLGKFILEWSIGNSEVRLLPYRGNRLARAHDGLGGYADFYTDHYHPNVEETYICFGSGEELAQTYLETGNIEKLCELVQALLVNYSEDDHQPFALLEDFDFDSCPTPEYLDFKNPYRKK